MNLTEIANRIANLHYPDVPKTKGDTMFRRQRVLELKKLVESELKNYSTPDEGRMEQLKCLMEDAKPNCDCKLDQCMKKGW
jgi:hypothetical protein